jgi:hypothetical protein
VPTCPLSLLSDPAVKIMWADQPRDGVLLGLKRVRDLGMCVGLCNLVLAVVEGHVPPCSFSSPSDQRGLASCPVRETGGRTRFMSSLASGLGS